MTDYAIYDTTSGRIYFVMSTNATPFVDAGKAYLAIPADTTVGFQTHQVDVAADPPALTAFVATVNDAQNAATQAAAIYCAGLFRAPAGFTWSGVLYQIDEASQQNIAAMGSLATASLANPATVPWPMGFYWIAADNTHVAMTAAQMLAFAAATAGYVSACILRFRAIKDAILAAGTASAVQAIDVTAGYPTASN